MAPPPLPELRPVGRYLAEVFASVRPTGGTPELNEYGCSVEPDEPWNVPDRLLALDLEFDQCWTWPYPPQPMPGQFCPPQRILRTGRRRASAAGCHRDFARRQRKGGDNAMTRRNV